jgi:hypothetical protein
MICRIKRAGKIEKYKYLSFVKPNGSMINSLSFRACVGILSSTVAQCLPRHLILLNKLEIKIPHSAQTGRHGPSQSAP